MLLATGSDVQIEPISIVMMNTESTKNVRLIIDIPGPLNVVLSILEMKGDPLIVKKSLALDQPRKKWLKGLAIAASNEPRALTDDPHADYNQQKVFSQISQLIANTAPVVDSEKMLSFERTFNDSHILSTFADDLLLSLKAAP